MSEMVERLARLIWFVHGDGLSVADAMSPGNDAHWKHWKDLEEARPAFNAAAAVLRAVREPTDHMFDAGETAAKHFCERWSMSIADEVFTAMIDAALPQGTPNDR